MGADFKSGSGSKELLDAWPMREGHAQLAAALDALIAAGGC